MTNSTQLSIKSRHLMFVFVLLLVPYIINCLGFQAMSGSQRSLRSKTVGESTDVKLFGHEHTWMSQATITENETSKGVKWFEEQAAAPARIRSTEDSVLAIRFGAKDDNNITLGDVFYLRNAPNEPLRLTGWQWQRLSRRRNSIALTPETTSTETTSTFNESELNELRKYLACKDMTNDQVVASALSTDNDFRFSMPVHHPKQVEPQTNEVQSNPEEGSPMLEAAMIGVLNKFNKSAESNLDGIVQEVDITAVVIGYELLKRGYTSELCTFIQHSFPDTSEDPKLIQATCSFLKNKYVDEHDSFWQRAFYATAAQRNKVLQSKVLNVLGEASRVVDPFVSSMNVLQEELKRQVDEKENMKGELILDFSPWKVLTRAFKVVVGRIQAAIPLHGYDTVLEVFTLVATVIRIQCDGQLPDGVFPRVSIPTSSWTVTESMKELTLVSMWEFANHVQHANGKVFLSMDAGIAGRVDVVPVVMSCLERRPNGGPFQSIYRVVTSMKGAGKKGVDAGVIQQFATDKVQKFVNARFGSSACTVTVLGTTLDGASDMKMLAKLNPQVTSPHCQMHVNSLVLSNAYAPSFGPGHIQPQDKPSVIGILKNLSYLIHDVVGIAQWKTFMKQAKAELSGRQEWNGENVELYGRLFDSEVLERMWKELEIYDGCVMFTRLVQIIQPRIHINTRFTYTNIPVCICTHLCIRSHTSKHMHVRTYIHGKCRWIGVR